MRSKIFTFCIALYLITSLNALQAQTLNVFDSIPLRRAWETSQKQAAKKYDGSALFTQTGPTYNCRVRQAVTGTWKSVFVTQTMSYMNPNEYDNTKPDNGYFKDLLGWTSSHIAFEFSNMNVEVEVSMADGSLINKAIVKPYNEASVTISTDKKTAIVTFTKNTNIYLDINGQMEDIHTGDGYMDNPINKPINTLCIFANPVYNEPTLGIVKHKSPTQNISDLGAWDAIIFDKGVHDIGTAFNLPSNKTFYISGDAIVHGSIHPAVGNKNWKVYGSGAISGEKFIRTGVAPVEWKIFTNNNEGFTVEGFVALDPPNHTFNMGNSGTATNYYTNVKLLTWRTNSDGINAFENSVIKNCFLRTQDDVFYLGTNVKIEDNVSWNDANGTVMYLARTSPNSTFKNHRAIYSRCRSKSWNKGVIELRDTDEDIENVTLENIVCEDPLPTYGLFRFTVADQGQIINNLNFINCRMDGTRQDGLKMWMLGKNPTNNNYSWWKNMTFNNCTYQGKCLDNIDTYFTTDIYVDKPTISFVCGSIPVTSVNIDNCPSSSLIINGTIDINCTVNPSNATNKNVTWTSSNTSVATVDANGLVIAKAVGSAAITVKTADGNKTATCNVTVVNNVPTPCVLPWTGSSFNVSATTVNYTSGSVDISCASSAKLSLTINGTSGVMETNQDYLIVRYRINGGSPILLAEKWGNFASQNLEVSGITGSTIELTIDGYTSSTTEIYQVTNLNISVGGSSTIPVTGVTIDNCLSTSLTINGTVDLAYTVLPTNATNQVVTWTSSNTSVATVDAANGFVTAKAAGSSLITVTTADGAKKATCNITVISAPACSLPWSTNDFTLGMGSAPYSSGAIDISCATSVTLSMDLSETDFFESDDKITVSYKINGGAAIVAKELINDLISSPVVVVVSGISGNSIEVIITAITHDALEIYSIKNLKVIVGGTTPVCNSWSTPNFSVTNTVKNYNSGLIDISCASSVTLSMDIAENSALENEDVVKVSYIIDSNPEVIVWNQINDFTSKVIGVPNLSGSKITVKIYCVTNDAQETISFSNIKVTVDGLKSAFVSENNLFHEDNLTTENSVQVYPNPVSGILNIDFSDSETTKEIRVYNTVGQLVYNTRTQNNTAQIDVQSLKIKGIACVQIVLGNEVSTHKIVVR